MLAAACREARAVSGHRGRRSSSAHGSRARANVCLATLRNPLGAQPPRALHDCSNTRQAVAIRQFFLAKRKMLGDFPGMAVTREARLIHTGRGMRHRTLGLVESVVLIIADSTRSSHSAGASPEQLRWWRETPRQFNEGVQLLMTARLARAPAAAARMCFHLWMRGESIYGHKHSTRGCISCPLLTWQAHVRTVPRQVLQRNVDRGLEKGGLIEEAGRRGGEKASWTAHVASARAKDGRRVAVEGEEMLVQLTQAASNGSAWHLLLIRPTMSQILRRFQCPTRPCSHPPPGESRMAVGQGSGFEARP